MPARPSPILFPAGPLPWLVPAIITGALVPVAVIAVGLSRHTLGANPISEALNELGLLALVFLVASLACTPLKTLTGWTWPVRVRKTLGLCAFFYALAHFLTYAVADQGLVLRAVFKDLTERPFIVVGLGALLLMVPLAITSTAKMLKRLGFARWKRLHRLSYLAGVLGVVHFVMRVKKDVTEPAIYGAILSVLFLVRLVDFLRERRDKRPRSAEP